VTDAFAERISAAAAHGNGIQLWSRAGMERVLWSDVLRRAKRGHRRLTTREPLVVSSEPSLDLIVHLVRAWLDDRCVVMLPPKTFLSSSREAPIWVSALSELQSAVSPSMSPIALLQPTSGTTRIAMAVPIPMGRLLSHCDAACAAAQMSVADRFVSWLPLHHDMGLIGLLIVPMLLGSELALTSPLNVVADRTLWPRMLTAVEGTITGGPNSSFEIFGRELAHASASSEQYDLTHLRLAFNGAERILPTTVRRIMIAGQRFNLRPEAQYCVYGLAEATVGVAFPQPGHVAEAFSVVGGAVGPGNAVQGTRFALTDDELLEQDGRSTYACVGWPIPGTDLELNDLVTGAVLQETQTMGEIVLRGRDISQAVPIGDVRQILGGESRWEPRTRLCTGDLGFLLDDGQLVVCGRLKSVISVRGRNVLAEDIEAVLATIKGVRTNGIAAVRQRDDRTGGEGIAVFVELRLGTPRERVSRDIRRLIGDHFGVTPTSVSLLDDDARLPRTSSGKIRRQELEPLLL
jgi:fatty-acyl-CoA synthase